MAHCLANFTQKKSFSKKLSNKFRENFTQKWKKSIIFEKEKSLKLLYLAYNESDRMKIW